jgi:1-acyl-sn-glycerol-3-phosphate acyltransferase
MRILGRVGVLLGGAAAALAHFAALWLQYRGMPPLRVRAWWLHTWCRWGVPKLGIEVLAGGGAPAGALIVANHLSYLDILVLSAHGPVLFVAKREVRRWPGFGLIARLAGAIFIERGRVRDLPRVIGEMRSALAAGVPVVLFPEGTTTDGGSVLAFRSGLFQSAVRASAPVTPAAIAYEAEGDPGREICWWGEMAFLPHLLNVLAKPRVAAQLEFCMAPHVWRSRKLAAILAHEQVTTMVCQLRASKTKRVAALPQATLEAAMGVRLG